MTAVHPRAADDHTPPATRPQLTKLAVCFDTAGVPSRDRARRLALCQVFTGRELASSVELTRTEAGRLIDLLDNDPLAVDRLAARLGEAQTPAPGPADTVKGQRHDPAAAVAGHGPAAPEPDRTGGPGTATPSLASLPPWTPIRRGPGCSPDGRHWVPPGPGTRWCACRVVAQVPRRTGACLPDGPCYCRRCPQYTPPREPDWRAAKAGLFRKEEERRERRRRR